ncbi:MAG: helix-turn-helix domain-containing protein [Candidatus Marsarchaeota archaeon]|nr:helix-turn-helix domain-containing protein [Candidatus Marsarchaeota archaeon]MCL5102288.1 helix-turn-helix domain-containing protein [Candidatus Marsarchaeota archaeon]
MNNEENGYDYVAMKFIPIVKARTAWVLFSKYGLTQQAISKMVGVSQAEVSKYLNKRPMPESDGIKIKDSDIESFAKSVLINDEYNAQRVICKICPKGVEKSCSIMIR